MVATKSIRLQVVEHVAATLNTISSTAAAGYHTNLSIGSGGGGAHLWQPLNPTAMTMPMVIVAGMRETPQSRNLRQQDQTLEIQIVALVAEPETVTGTEALDLLMSDIQKAVLLAPNRGLSNNTVTDTKLGEAEIKPREDLEGRLAATVTITVNYRHKYGDPALPPGFP